MHPKALDAVVMSDQHNTGVHPQNSAVWAPEKVLLTSSVDFKHHIGVPTRLP
jgi:hypothetical protein